MRRPDRRGPGRRGPGPCGAVLLVLLVAALLAACRSDPPPRLGDADDVVLIVIDTLRADRLPFYGYGRDTAPFLSRLAAAGVVFERAHSTSSWTAPATASLFTSLYPVQHGVVTGLHAARRQRLRLRPIPDVLETLPEVFRRAGFRTYGVADNWNVGPELGFDRGFDRLRTFSYRSARAVNRVVGRWRSSLLAGGRTFLYLHYMDPHGPLHPRAPWYEPPNTPPSDPEAERRAAYDSEISYADDHIARLFESLGWERDTLIVVTADHGQEHGDHGDTGHGKTLYSEVLDVPLLFYHPRLFGGGRRVEERVSLIDVLPTLAELAGLEANPRWAGASLAGLLAGAGAGPGARDLLAHLDRTSEELFGDPPRRSVHGLIRGDWKLLRSAHAAEELYDLARDPREARDRLAAERARADELGAALTAFLRDAPDYRAPAADLELGAEEAERLRALGYL